MTLREVTQHIEAYLEKIKQKNETEQYLAWLNGSYVAAAIGCTFGKKSYPKNPLESNSNELEIHEDMTDEEKREMTEKLFANLEIMKANYELAHKEGNGE